MAVLGKLLDFSPPVILCVIDGFEELDHKTTKHYLNMFLEKLRGHKMIKDPQARDTERVIKTLFTTSGGSKCLLNSLTRDELVFTQQSSAARNPGKPASSRRSLSPEILDRLRKS